MTAAPPAQTTQVVTPPAGPACLEPARLRALRDYVDVHATPPPELQAIVRLAARLTGNANAAVNIIDETLQHQLVTEGFDPFECAREDAMCQVTVEQRGVVHVPDARRDPRFAANPWVDGRNGFVRSYASAPLLTPDGHALGTLCVFDDVERTLDERQLGDLRDLAQVVVSLFDRERRARREAADLEALHDARQAADLSLTLQQALLPHRLVGSGTVALTSRYLPGTDGAQIGGDFFDAVRTDEAFVVVMGDVQGHNTHAAALMGRVRTAVRAYTTEGHSPSAVLARTNRLMESFESGLFATCCLLSLDERTGDVTVASAGHPAPLLFSPGPVRTLDVDPGPPLGVTADAVFPETRHRLGAASRLLLYTDGVVEWARDSGQGEQALRTALTGEAAAAPAAELAERVLAPAARAKNDDAALLVVDYSGPAAGTREARLELPADARAVGTARAHLRATLRAWDLGGTEDAAELVVSELVTNALLHTGSGPALVLRHDAAEAVLSVGVEDAGTHHPQPREALDEATGGRGLQIVQLVARRWWVAPHGDGKTVWADLDAS